jgi:protein-S-isoprenylcysteine O-methyltransferase Ste14
VLIREQVGFSRRAMRNSASIVRMTRCPSHSALVILQQDIPMTRIFALLYGVVSYAVFLVTILYAIGFVDGWMVPKDIDGGAAAPLAEALVINIALMSLFAIQHSVMARQSFKRWWTQYIPTPIERSTYVLLASAALLLLFWQWRPLTAIVWQIDNADIATAMTALSLLGWLIVFTSTYLINHFELFGLQQVIKNMSSSETSAPVFRTPLYYKFVRHPIYLGFVIAFWATPVMTVGHLLFAAVTTAYIFVGIALEERDLIDLFGDDYRRYRERVSMLIPWRKSADGAPAPTLDPLKTTRKA